MWLAALTNAARIWDGGSKRDETMDEKTYPDGEVERQPNTSEISGRERQSLLGQQVFGYRVRSAVSNNGRRV